MRRLVLLLSATVMLTLAPFTAPGPGLAVGPTAPQRGLVLHYPMEALSQGTVADDSGTYHRALSLTEVRQLASRP